MTRAWTKRILVGCLLTGPFACTVSVNDGPLDEVGGTSGGSGISGSSGVSGSSGASGTGGASGNGGSGAQGGSAGSMSMVENGGGGGTTQVPTPVCTAEASDAQDPCLTCIKQECCTEWQACNDSSCQQERKDMQECVSMLEAADQDTYGACATMSSTTMDFLQPNTEALFECVNKAAGDAGQTTRCGSACFGMDVFL